MVWIHAIGEHDLDIQNPTNPEKLCLLGTRLKFSPGQRILDVGAGRGGPALLYATEFGCHITAVERFSEFAEAARRRAADAGVSDHVDVVEMDGRRFEIEAQSYDVAMCLGASFIYGGLEPTLDALGPAVRDKGHVIVGEPYRNHPDEKEGGMHDFTFPQILAAFENRNLPVATFVRASQDDWDRYIGGRVVGILDWLNAHPGHEDSSQVEGWRIEEYEQYVRSGSWMGWAIVAGRRH